MAKIFKNTNPGRRKNRPKRGFKPKKQNFQSPAAKARPKTTAKDLVDPVLYIGGLDKETYPTLPIEKKEKKPEEEIENPLNKR
ncbi:hypothetical protein HOB10_01900 [Candidatus Parcubacteria bacterium]|jgi:hypothetical protein|nr:hypothetical protein [Candidatus Parcubacteria bacterium]